MKNISLRLLSLSFFSSMTLLQASVGLDYLNSLRAKADIALFSEEVHLSNSAQNHSDYMQTNNVSGHYEDSSKTGYTGDAPVDRTLYIDYLSRIVGENISVGQVTVQASIDGLFSAIYHRYGFLSLEKNEIGIGINGHFYTYDMGNMGVNNLCQGASASSGYQGICKDLNKVINTTDYSNAINVNKESAPELILWPPVNSDDIPPVFYEESPDPLPNDSVTGYPVSVEFNDGKFTAAPTVSTFVLTEAVYGSEQQAIIVMDEGTDSNNYFNAYQFALFPRERLEWGTPYNIELVYSSGGVETTKNWCFQTRSLQNTVERFYRIENNTDVTLDVISGKVYAIYVVPNNSNDRLGGVTYSSTIDFSSIDGNTVSVKLTGHSDETAQLSFSNGQKITLIIKTTDTAISPSNITCDQVNDYDGDGILNNEDLDDDNDGYSDVHEIIAGSDPLNENSKPLDSDNDKIPNIIDTDDDNDGILDTVEKAHGLNPLNASDAQADFDDDGFTNIIEVSVGSDIRSNTSKPAWTPMIMGDIMIFVPSF